MSSLEVINMPIDSRQSSAILERLGIGPESLIGQQEQQGIAERFLAMARREAEEKKVADLQQARADALAEKRSGGISRARGFVPFWDNQAALKTLLALDSSDKVLRAFLAATKR